MSNLLKDNKELLKEWDYEKNDNALLDIITCGSGKKVWWKCEKGHVWEAAIYSRPKNKCPYCANRKILIGYNDLKSQKPELLKEWDYDKNKKIGIEPKKIIIGSSQKAYWICPQGHSYFTEVRARAIYGYGCKYCAGNGTVIGENDLETDNPSLLKEWNYDRNVKNPQCYSSHSKDIVWWKCAKGHEWKASISNRNHSTNPTKCPICLDTQLLQGYNDLYTKNPNLIKEWDYNKNNQINILPDKIIYNSRKKAWWKCEKSHEWLCSITSRNKGMMCPYCSRQQVLVGYNDLATTHPYLLKEWAYEKNKNLKPEFFTSGSNVRVWWKCQRGHEWEAMINTRTRGSGCLECSSGMHTSFPEQAIYYYLSKIYKCSNRFKLNDKYEYDIFIQELNFLIEYDGIYYHKKIKKKNNIDKEKIARDYNYNFLRIEESDKYLESCFIKNNKIIYYYDKSNRLNDLIIKLFSFLKVDSSYDIDVNRDFVLIESQMNYIVHGNNVTISHPNIIYFWDYKKNNNLKPEYYLPQSGKKVWWKCENGHSFLLRICDFVNGRNCPYCSNKKLLIGYNDLYTKYPSLLDYWDNEKNSISIKNVIYSSSNKYFWKCEKGHSFQRTIKKILKNNVCPYCSNSKVLTGYNDFASTNPELLQEWDYNKNSLNPNEIILADKYKIWWICSKCGYTYEKTIYNRKRHASCPNCKYDITKRPVKYRLKKTGKSPVKKPEKFRKKAST